METTRAIIENRLLLKSINFSYAALIFSVVLKFLFSHIFEILLFFVFLLIFKVSVIGLVFYPLIAIVFCFFIYGASLFLSALTVYFIDLENIWLFISTLIWFGTPIFYAIEGQTRLFALNLVNPMYYFITLSREVLIYARMPELWMIFGTLIFTLLSLVVGVAVFGKLRRRFAELI
jgi:ABC-type polysaccharide/polyol phosphate export permease